MAPFSQSASERAAFAASSASSCRTARRSAGSAAISPIGMVGRSPSRGRLAGAFTYAASSVMMWDAKSGSAPLPRGPGDGEVAVVLGAVPMLDEVDEAALGEVVGAAAEQAQRGARRRVAEAAEGGAVEREIAAVVLEDRAGRGLRHPGAELDLADAGSGNPDDRALSPWDGALEVTIWPGALPRPT